MSSEELFTKGARIWIPDPDVVWRGAELLRDYKSGDDELKVIFENGEGEIEESTVPLKDSQLPPLRNPDILIGENDLTALSYLHEPGVLHNLSVRFLNQNTIYTYCGIVLVAINPYQDLPIYDVDTIHAYMGQDMGSLDPHIFAVAEEAYKNMSRFERNQSIIVSGESGAGKTVSAKYAMRYFASVGGSQTETQIEKKVLASNPIMEAIGNAKTTRNDNSSRFGKYIEISFNDSNYIVGASMRTYLLEKSRVVYQANEERNYHIFYQLCASYELPEFESFKLNSRSHFDYTNQGNCAHITGVDDAADLWTTRQAFTLLGINEDVQMSIFRVLAAILHLGNIEIGGADHAEVYSDDPALLTFCELMGVDTETMSLWLMNRKITTVNETMIKALNPQEAMNSRDALAKHIYSCLFNWIVQELNKALVGEGRRNKFIGVLDIYGFETFEVNSFEQFCINYANEKLQQQFNLHVFKLEQEEYVKEGINWNMIDFYDNQPCIDLIESKLGILDLLDEECRMPKGSDSQWCIKLYDKHGGGKKKHFEKPRMSNINFIIHHFADRVDYLAEGFLEKNRDSVQEEQLNVLKAAQFGLISELLQQDHLITPAAFAAAKGPTRSRSGQLNPRNTAPLGGAQLKGTKLQKKTVGSQFRDSLNELMATLTSTEPHYVRCIKPNDVKAAFTFDEKRAVQQLRACGVLETVRISAAGYPSRWTYAEFFSRYRVLIHSKLINRSDLRKTCEVVLQKLIQESCGVVNEDKFQFGRTKIFFRAGQVAYLEKLRSDRLRACGVLIQKRVRGWIAQRRYERIRKAVLLTQRFGRGLLARKLARRLKEDKAATKIQAVAKGFLEHRRYMKIRWAVQTIQSYTRGWFARKLYLSLTKEKAAIILQKYVRQFICERRFQKMRLGLVLLQSHARRKRAAKELKRLRTEAKSMNHLKKLNKGLENKIIELQQKITEQNKLQETFRKREDHIKDLQEQVKNLKGAKAEAQQWANKIVTLEEEIERLQLENENLRGEKADILYEKELVIKEKDDVVISLEKDNEDSKKALEKLGEDLKALKVQSEENQKQALDSAKREWEKAHEDELVRYQKLLGDYNRLEQRYENVQEELQMHRSGGVAGVTSPTGAKAAVKTRPGSTSTEMETVKENGDAHGAVDMGLVMRLQNRLKNLEQERDDLKRKNEEQVQESNLQHDNRASETIRLQELEMENAKLRDQMERYRKSVTNSAEFEKQVAGANVNANANQETVDPKVFIDEVQAMREELERRREESIHLKSILANRSQDQAVIARDSYGGNPELINEDGELEIAYRAEKQTNKFLNMQVMEKDKTLVNLRKQVEKLQQENEEKQRIMTQAISGKPENTTEAMLLHQNQMLTVDNLDLKEKNDDLTERCEKYKRTIKSMAKRQAAAGGTQVVDDEVAASQNLDVSRGAGVMANILRKEQEFKGMLSYPQESELQLIKNLILELKPKLAANLLPGLPAYILFMCIRHTDSTNDDAKLKSLLGGTVNGIKRVVKKYNEDAERVTLWLANTCRLLNNLKQYSGEKAFQQENSQKQNEQSLRNFDLSEYRQVLADLAVWIYQGLVRIFEAKIQSLIITSILENEAIAGISQTKPVGMRGRGGADATKAGKQSSSNKNTSQSLDSLMRCLNNYLKMMNVHGVDPEIVNQVFKQLFYYICASSMNNLLLRKEMCHWSRGMQIRFNLSHLEQWIHENHLDSSDAVSTLQPIVQASQLLQARKEEDDVEAICDMCSKLTTSQIVKILNLYTPHNEFEGRVSIPFIRRVQDRLKKRDLTNLEKMGAEIDVQKQSQQGTLLMDTQFTFPVRFPFCSSTIALETIIVPESLNLPFLKRV